MLNTQLIRSQHVGPFSGVAEVGATYWGDLGGPGFEKFPYASPKTEPRNVLHRSPWVTVPEAGHASLAVQHRTSKGRETGIRQPMRCSYRIPRRQRKHGHAANIQGARSSSCCGESPRALAQKVPVGDHKVSAISLQGSLVWSCFA